MERAVVQAHAAPGSTFALRFSFVAGFLAGAVALALFAFPYATAALELRTGEQPSIRTEERVLGDAYVAGGNVASSGVVTGDLIVAGGTVLVTGGVGADLAAAGGSLTLLGNVADDVRAAGGNVVLQGAVGGDMVVAGGQLQLGGSGITGDLLAGGGTVRLEAPVGGNVRIAGGTVYLNSAIRGDVEVFAETLTLGKSARILGALTYTAGKEATLEEGAVVSGETTFQKRDRTISVGEIVAIFSLAFFGVFLAQLISALLLGLFFRRFSLTLVESVVEKPLLEVGRGLVIIIVLPVVSIALLWTVLGIPLGILGLVSFGATILFLWMMTPVVLGSLSYRAFFKGEYRVDWKTILLGVVIYTLLDLIPIVGWLTQLLLMLLTLGIAAKVKWRIAKEWR